MKHSLGTAGVYILLTLSKGDQHGYTIMKTVETLSNSSVHLGPATLYTNIKRLVDQGLITESDNRPDPEMDDQRRRYYRLTTQGKAVLQEEMDRLQLMLDQFKKKLA